MGPGSTAFQPHWNEPLLKAWGTVRWEPPGRGKAGRGSHRETRGGPLPTPRTPMHPQGPSCCCSAGQGAQREERSAPFTPHAQGGHTPVLSPKAQVPSKDTPRRPTGPATWSHL